MLLHRCVLSRVRVAATSAGIEKRWSSSRIGLRHSDAEDFTGNFCDAGCLTHGAAPKTWGGGPKKGPNGMPPALTLSSRWRLPSTEGGLRASNAACVDSVPGFLGG